MRSLPLQLRHNRGCVHWHMTFSFDLPNRLRLLSRKILRNRPMKTARIRPVDAVPATIAAVLAIHTGHILFLLRLTQHWRRPEARNLRTDAPSP